MASEDVTRMVLSFFLQQEYYRALIALEQDSKVRLWSYGKEIDFFYDLITEGKFEDVERLVETVKEKSALAHSRIIGHIRKEKFLEALEGKVLPDAQELATALKDIDGLLSREEYESLCSVLTAEHRSESAANWDIWRGRYMCFQDCLKCLQELYTIDPPSQKPRSLLTVLNGTSEDGAFSDRSKPNRPPKESNRYSSDSSLETASPVADSRPNPPEKRSPRPRDRTQAESLMDRMDPARVAEVARVTDVQAIRAAVFSPNGEWYALGTKSKSMRIYALKEVIEMAMEGRTGTIEQKFAVEIDNLHQGSVYCIDWSRNGTQIATGSNDKTISVCTVPSLDHLHEPIVIPSPRANRDSPDFHIRIIPNLPGTLRSLCFHPQDDPTLFSSGDGEGDILVWQTESLQLIRRLAGHQGGTTSLAVAADASFLLSGGQDRWLRMWDLRSSKCIRQINAEIFGDVTCVALNCATHSMLSDSPQLLAAAAHSDGIVSVWDLTAAQLFSKHSFHRESCRAVEFSSDAKWLASASFDQSIGLTSLRSGESYRIQGHAGKVVSVHWHPRLPLVLSTSTDKTARVFRIGS